VDGAVVSGSLLLGHSAEDRVLIVNCDDFGLYPAVNAGVVAAVEHGLPVRAA
jgi:hypothetical protein